MAIDRQSHKPLWLKRSEDEVESLIVKLSREGMQPEKVGLVLRDTYGIPSSKILVGKIKNVLSSKGIMQEPSDILNLEKKLAKLKLHLSKNKVDQKAKYSSKATEAKIIRLKRYYSRKKTKT